MMGFVHGSGVLSVKAFNTLSLGLCLASRKLIRAELVRFSELKNLGTIPKNADFPHTMERVNA